MYFEIIYVPIPKQKYITCIGFISKVVNISYVLSVASGFTTYRYYTYLYAYQQIKKIRADYSIINTILKINLSLTQLNCLFLKQDVHIKQTQ